MSFKKAQVQSGQISGTSHNDFPVYVDLSRVGITTLAEAESSRWYMDEDKIVEIAREVVGATEGHGKIPTLDSTTELFIDYDSIRSDYAVGATYGRNAVWGDYIFVFHFENNVTNSAGGSGVTGTNNSTTDVVGGPINGRARQSNNLNRHVTLTGLAAAIANENLTFTCWLKMEMATPTISNNNHPFGVRFNSGNDNHYPFVNGQAFINTLRRTSRVDSISLSDSIARNAWHKLTISNQSGTNGWKFYQNDDMRIQVTGDTFSGSDLGDNGAVILNSDSRTSGGSRRMNGDGDEYRLAAFTQSANWITTEYNNQNDNDAFWGTWEDAGGGGGGTDILGIKLGSTTINKVMLGSTEIKRIYLGATKIFEKL